MFTKRSYFYLLQYNLLEEPFVLFVLPYLYGDGNTTSPVGSDR
jgi:hypothetical protein